MPTKKSKSRNPKEKRNYRKEYLRDHASTERKKYRAALNRKNRESQAAGRTQKGDGKDMAHARPVRKGAGHNSATKPQDAASNRAWRKGKKGYDRG